MKLFSINLLIVSTHCTDIILHSGGQTLQWHNNGGLKMTEIDKYVSEGRTAQMSRYFPDVWPDKRGNNQKYSRPLNYVPHVVSSGKTNQGVVLFIIYSRLWTVQQKAFETGHMTTDSTARCIPPCCTEEYLFIKIQNITGCLPHWRCHHSSFRHLQQNYEESEVPQKFYICFRN